jgi:poly-beta-1,6-N-acetyl-D-glucosamine synthase
LEIYYWIALVVMSTYGFWMGWMLIGLLQNSKERGANESNIGTPLFSIVIPFKNEEKTLPHLIRSIEKAYAYYSDGLVEIICMDDHSIDKGAEWLETYIKQTQLPIHLFRLNSESSGKKHALFQAAQLAQGDYIVTTDADCEVPETWLEDWYKSFRQHADLFIGVVLQNNTSNNFSGVQQEIESLLLQGITKGTSKLGKPLLCSGANLGYVRDKLLCWRPYDTNFSIASGDDMFLLQSARENKAIIVFAESVVFTNAEVNWESYIQRSVRWSGKIVNLNNPLLRWLAIITFLANLFFLVGLFIFLFEGSIGILLTVIIKFFVDFLCLFFVCMNFNRFKLVIFAPLIAVSYPIYLLIVGLKQIGNQKKVWS